VVVVAIIGYLRRNRHDADGVELRGHRLLLRICMVVRRPRALNR
jgi:hypothetical protein